jgi:guanine deaminase
VAPYDGRPVDEDLRPGVLLPGFVDAHVHFPQTRIVGRASGPLLDWLDRATFPEEARFADPAHAERVAATFCSRLAAAGTTLAMVYSSVHPRTADLLFQTLDRVGLEAIAGPVLMDEHCPEALRLPASEALPALADLADRWHGVERFGTRDYLEVYEQAGLVHDRCVLAHCIHLSGSEWDRLAAAGAVVGHCPDSNDFLGSGGMPVPEVLDRAMKVAIGTDIAAGRSFRVPRILSSAYDNGLRQGVPLSEARLLWWGTRGGALALGRPSAGVLAPGFDANLCLFEPPDPADDAEAVLASLLFDHDAPRMRRTWVRGRLVHAEEGWPTKSA